MVIETLKKLLSIPSVYGNEKQIADFVESTLRKISSLKVYRKHNSLIAHTEFLKGRRTIGLVGHLDTVPNENSLTGQIIDGKLYGLGASDMKAGDAVIIELAKDLLRKENKYNLIFIFYEKEEGPYVDNGLGLIFDDFMDILKRINFAFILEPTDNTIQAGCLGVINAWFKFKGKRAHSARPWQGRNAIQKGWKLLKALDDLKPMEHLINGLSFFEVANATMVGYNGARNIIPESFKVNINYRFSPDKTIEEAKAYLLRLKDETDTDDVEFSDVSPAARPCLDNELLNEFIDRFKLKVEPKQAWTDVARFSHNNIDAVNFGPGQPSQAHQKNEYVEVEKVRENFRMLEEFLFQ